MPITLKSLIKGSDKEIEIIDLTMSHLLNESNLSFGDFTTLQSQILNDTNLAYKKSILPGYKGAAMRLKESISWIEEKALKYEMDEEDSDDESITMEDLNSPKKLGLMMKNIPSYYPEEMIKQWSCKAEEMPEAEEITEDEKWPYEIGEDLGMKKTKLTEINYKNVEVQIISEVSKKRKRQSQIIIVESDVEDYPIINKLKKPKLEKVETLQKKERSTPDSSLFTRVTRSAKQEIDSSPHSSTTNSKDKKQNPRLIRPSKPNWLSLVENKNMEFKETCKKAGRNVDIRKPFDKLRKNNEKMVVTIISERPKSFLDKAKFGPIGKPRAQSTILVKN